jgi:peptide/nickel transport system permease protein
MLIVGILIGVLAITFILSRVLPGSPVQMLLGPRATPDQIKEVRGKLGLDRPVYEQFIIYLKDAIRGDLGTSIHTKQPVLDDILLRMTATFELTILALIIIIFVGVPLGVFSAIRQNSITDHTVRVVSIAGAALPMFLIGMLLQLLLCSKLGWLPIQGRLGYEITLDHPFDRITGLYLVDTLLAGQTYAFWDAVKHLVCPTLTLSFGMLPNVSRMTRNMMMEVLREDYVRTLIAYGINQKRIYFLYALKATLIPLLTVIGLTYGFLLSGTVVVEYVFDWPGLGGYAVFAIFVNDFPAVMGVTLFLAAAFLTINLVIDLLYYLVDPRLRMP